MYCYSAHKQRTVIVHGIHRLYVSHHQVTCEVSCYGNRQEHCELALTGEYIHSAVYHHEHGYHGVKRNVIAAEYRYRYHRQPFMVGIILVCHKVQEHRRDKCKEHFRKGRLCYPYHNGSKRRGCAYAGGGSLLQLHIAAYEVHQEYQAHIEYGLEILHMLHSEKLAPCGKK